MIARRIARALFSNIKKQVVPKPPKLLQGQLESFKFSAENAQLYDGYTLDELYGVKIGPKHPEKIKTEMLKDNVAVGLLLLIGIGVIMHINNIYKSEYQQIKKAQQSRYSRQVTLPN